VRIRAHLISRHILVFFLASFIATAGCRHRDSLNSAVHSSSEGAIATGNSQTVGFEIEMASPEVRASDPSKIEDKYYSIPLDIIRNTVFQGQGSDVRVQIIPNDPRRLKFGEYDDPSGRKWKVMPEWTNSLKADGFEFVSAPLARNEIPSFFEAVEAVISTGQYGVGSQSGFHVNVDVSHHIEAGEIRPSTNVTKLVDLILYLESHIIEIYAALSPKRSGTIINRFNVPLAANQQNLLRELADLPSDRRTFQRVKDVFEKHHETEIELMTGLFDGDRERAIKNAYKYRAFNYRKLFGLAGASQLSIIECRIPDVTLPAQMQSSTDFIVKLVDQGPRLHRNKKFSEPLSEKFSNIMSNKDFAGISQVVLDFPKEKYRSFTEKLGYTDKELPKLGRIRGPPRVDLADPVGQRAYQDLDISSPIKLGRRNVTFGFEIEYAAGAKGRKLTESKDTIRYIDGPSFHVEGTGNHELASKPTDRLETTLTQMREIRSMLGEDARAFHMHFRFPKTALKVDDKEFSGWLARISDGIVAWRLQNRMHFFALKVETQTRLDPILVTNRGTMRLIDFGDTWDIEVRGFMTDVEMIEKTARLIISGIQNPELIQGFYHHQRWVFEPVRGIRQELGLYSQKYFSRPLNEFENSRADLIGNAISPELHLPLVGYEHAPYFTELQQVKLRNAKLRFIERTYNLIQNRNHSQEELDKQYRYLIKQWGQEMDLHTMLYASILMRKPRSLSHLSNPWLLRDLAVTADEIMKNPRGHEARKDMDIVSILKDLPRTHLAEAAKSGLTQEEIQTLQKYAESKSLRPVAEVFTKANKARMAEGDQCQSLQWLYHQ
jgi:hypothetical protein